MSQDSKVSTMVYLLPIVDSLRYFGSQGGISLNLSGTHFSASLPLPKEEARKLMNGLQDILSIQDRKQSDAWKELASSLALRAANESSSTTPSPVEPAPSGASQPPSKPGDEKFSNRQLTPQELLEILYPMDSK